VGHRGRLRGPVGRRCEGSPPARTLASASPGGSPLSRVNSCRAVEIMYCRSWEALVVTGGLGVGMMHGWQGGGFMQTHGARRGRRASLARAPPHLLGPLPRPRGAQNAPVERERAHAARHGAWAAARPRWAGAAGRSGRSTAGVQPAARRRSATGAGYAAQRLQRGGADIATPSCPPPSRGNRPSSSWFSQRTAPRLKKRLPLRARCFPWIECVWCTARQRTRSPATATAISPLASAPSPRAGTPCGHHVRLKNHYKAYIQHSGRASRSHTGASQPPRQPGHALPLRAAGPRGAGGAPPPATAAVMVHGSNGPGGERESIAPLVAGAIAGAANVASG
jgi:hypothetical protein